MLSAGRHRDGHLLRHVSLHELGDLPPPVYRAAAAVRPYDQKSYNESEQFVRRQIVNTYSCPSDLFHQAESSKRPRQLSAIPPRIARCVGGSHWDANESPVVDTSAACCANVPGQTGFHLAISQKLAGLSQSPPRLFSPDRGLREDHNRPMVPHPGLRRTVCRDDDPTRDLLHTRTPITTPRTATPTDLPDGLRHLQGEDGCGRRLHNNWSSMHPGGINFATVDGSVQFLTTTIISVSATCVQWPATRRWFLDYLHGRRSCSNEWFRYACGLWFGVAVAPIIW